MADPVPEPEIALAEQQVCDRRTRDRVGCAAANDVLETGIGIAIGIAEETEQAIGGRADQRIQAHDQTRRASTARSHDRRQQRGDESDRTASRSAVWQASSAGLP